MIVIGDYLVRLGVRTGHVTRDESVLELKSFELVDEAEPADFLVAKLFFQSFIVDRLFAQTGRRSGP